MYLASEKGKRVLNFCYSWGASIVIIGALFKLLHLPYGNQILFVAMTVEALVFFISAFEKPFNEYHWEEVFPVLKSKNPLDRPDFANTPMSNLVNSPENTTDDEVAGGLNINLGGKQATGLGNLGLDVSEEDTKNLSDSIKKLSAAVCATLRPAATASAPNEMPYSPVATEMDKPMRTAGVHQDKGEENTEIILIAASARI